MPDPRDAPGDPGAPPPGTRVRVTTKKWPAQPHWSFSGVLLGSDRHGDWIGLPGGTRFERPGVVVHPPQHQLTLVPAAVDGLRPGWLAGCHGPGGRQWAHLDDEPVDVYVDVTTPPWWSGDTVTAVDLDLDAIRARSGLVVLDDEDEFADHQVRFGYPAEVIAEAERTADLLLALLRSGSPPFDRPTIDDWLHRLEAHT